MGAHGEAFAAGVIDFLPDATFVIDLDGVVTAWNRAMEELTGVAAEAVLGRGEYEYALPFYGERRPMLADLVFVPDEELEARYDHVTKAGDTLVVDVFIPGFRPGGATFWAKAGPLSDDDGVVVGAIETIRDISDRRASEEELIQSRRRLAETVDFLPDATFVIDLDGVVRTWNRAMEEMTGLAAAAIIGKGDYEYALPFYGERRPLLANLILMPGEEVESRYTHVRREGDTLVADTYIPQFGESGRWLWAKASPLYDAEGAVVGAIETIRDITERREMEASLARSQAELQIAAEIQRSFLPDVVPQLGGFEIAGRAVMAAEVGGDFFDVIPFEVVSVEEGKLGILIADVSGKGVPAALFMALSRIVVRVNALWHDDPAQAISHANNVIAHDAKGGMFVTLFYGSLCEKTRTLTYVNAGHNPPILFRCSDGSQEELTRTGIALGAAEHREFTCRSVAIGPGDGVVLYTDGVTEACDDRQRMFGEERLRRVVAANMCRSAEEILSAILDEVLAFAGDAPQFDDITLLVVKGV